MSDCDACKSHCPGWTRCHLVQIQPTSELARKANKARRRQKLWTVEELDLCRRKGLEMAEYLAGNDQPKMDVREGAKYAAKMGLRTSFPI